MNGHLRCSLLAVGLLAGGCAHGPTDPVQASRYAKPGATQEQFMEDRFQCLQESQQRTGGGFANPMGAGINAAPNCGMFAACMSARGYVADASGPLAPPPGAIPGCNP